MTPHGDSVYHVRVIRFLWKKKKKNLLESLVKAARNVMLGQGDEKEAMKEIVDEGDFARNLQEEDAITLEQKMRDKIRKEGKL